MSGKSRKGKFERTVSAIILLGKETNYFIILHQSFVSPAPLGPGIAVA